MTFRFGRRCPRGSHAVGEGLRGSLTFGADGSHYVGKPVWRRRLAHNRLPGCLVEFRQLSHLERTQPLAKNRRSCPGPLGGNLTLYQATEQEGVRIVHKIIQQLVSCRVSR